MDGNVCYPNGAKLNRIQRRSAFLCFAVLCFLFLAAAFAVYEARHPSSPGTKVSQNTDITIDYSNASEGYISVKHAQSDRKTKLRVIYAKNTDTYDLACDGSYYVFPLKHGSGTYSINIYQQASGSKYAQVYGTEITVTISDELSCYLYPNQRVWWTSGSEIETLSAEICSGLETDLEKIQALYKWVSTNIKYNYIKALNIESGYLPNNEETLKSKTGICYDYASLLCAMLRSQGIYAQLATGKLNGDTYHAWNRVYVNGAWKMLDATFGNKYGADCYKLDNTF